MPKAELTNHVRLEILGSALFSKRRWKKPLSTATGISRQTLIRCGKGEGGEPMDDTVNRALAYAKQKRDEIDRAINAVRMYPWIV